MVPSSELVSVILPTRNRAGLLTRAIKSVLAQTFQNFELIIVDEASSDQTSEVIESLKDERVQSIRHEVARGPSAARNAGLQRAQGEYVAFLDDDDEFLPHKLQSQLDGFRSAVSAVGIVISPVEYSRNGKRINFFPYNGESGNIFLNVLAGNTFPLNAVLIRRHNLPEFDDKLSCLEDMDFFLKLLQNTKAMFVETPCAICRLDDDIKRGSTNRINLYRSFRILQTRWFNDPNDAFLKAAQSDLLVNFALRQFALGNFDDAARENINKAYAMKKDSRRTMLKLQNILGVGVLRWLHGRQ